MGDHNIADIKSSADLQGKLGAQNLSKGPATKTAFELLQEEVLNGYILSYNEKLDIILKNQIALKTITEFSGESGSGKTQVCFQLCISVQLPKWCGGLGGEAIYIGTNNNFASHRLTELTNNFIQQYNNLNTKSSNKIDVDFILKHIYYIKAKDGLELVACIDYLKSFLKGRNVKLIIIDSISYPLKLLDMKTRKTIICRIFQDLRMLASIFSFAVVFTNNLTTRINEGESYTTPSLGDSFYHLVNTRVLFSKKDTVFHAKLIKSTFYNKQETVFSL